MLKFKYQVFTINIGSPISQKFCLTTQINDFHLEISLILLWLRYPPYRIQYITITSSITISPNILCIVNKDLQQNLASLVRWKSYLKYKPKNLVDFDLYSTLHTLKM